MVIIPFVDKLVRVSLRTVALDVPPQDVITRDNVSVKVNAVIYFRVVDQQRAIIQIQDYLYATSMMAQTTLRSVLGQSQLDDLLAKREEINSKLQFILDQQTEPWGVKVSAVEVKNVDLPQEMQRVIAKQAEAERERRSKVIHAEGEFQAAQRLADAATVMGQNPIALQLRYLQTLVESPLKRIRPRSSRSPSTYSRPSSKGGRNAKQRGKGEKWRFCHAKTPPDRVHRHALSLLSSRCGSTLVMETIDHLDGSGLRSALSFFWLHLPYCDH